MCSLLQNPSTHIRTHHSASTCFSRVWYGRHTTREPPAGCCSQEKEPHKEGWQNMFKLVDISGRGAIAALWGGERRASFVHWATRNHCRSLPLQRGGFVRCISCSSADDSGFTLTPGSAASVLCLPAILAEAPARSCTARSAPRHARSSPASARACACFSGPVG